MMGVVSFEKLEGTSLGFEICVCPSKMIYKSRHYEYFLNNFSSKLVIQL